MKVVGAEILEARTLRSTSLGGNGILFIAGTAGDDGISLFRNAEGDELLVKLKRVYEWSSAAGVKGIVIDTRSGDDSVNIVTENGDPIGLPVTVWTHAGNDVLTGGAGTDRFPDATDVDITDYVQGQDTGGPPPASQRELIEELR